MRSQGRDAAWPRYHGFGVYPDLKSAGDADATPTLGVCEDDAATKNLTTMSLREALSVFTLRAK